MLGAQPAQPRCVPGRVRVRFEHNGIAGGERRAELVEDDLDRKVRRGDRADDADRLLDDSAYISVAEETTAFEDTLPSEVVDQPGGITQRVRQRPVELGGLCCHRGAAHLGHELLAQVVLVRLDRRLQLFQTALA